MSYGIYFDSSTPAEALRQALHTVYGISPELVYVGRYDGLKDHPGPDPIVVITSAGGDFGNELGRRTPRLAGRGHRAELARTLARVAGTWALVDDGGPARDYWFLVARDGSYGR